MDQGFSTTSKDDELYDLENDPWELPNVALDPANVSVLSTMRALLNEWQMDTEDFNPVPLPDTVGRQSRPWLSSNNAAGHW